MSVRVPARLRNWRAGLEPQKRVPRRARSFNHFIGSPPCKSESEEAVHDGPRPQQAGASFRLAVKDNIATDGFPTTCASGMLASHRSPFEATIVSQLRKRGAIVVGKTNMDEFGMGSHSIHSAFGPVGNPPSADSSASAAPVRSAGGSSGGSAVAVKTGEVDVALGTDTGGSVRMPAAYTGIVGYKPSYGMLSRWGVVPYANSLDTVGLLAKDVDTVHNLLFGMNLHMEHDLNDPTSLSTAFRSRARDPQAARHSNLTIGLPIEYNIAELDPHLRQAWADTAACFATMGARICLVSLPTTRHALSAYYVLAAAEASSNLAKYDGVRYGARAQLDYAVERDLPEAGTADAALESLYAKRRGFGFGEEVCRRILLGNYTLSSNAKENHFLQAQRVRRLVQRDFDRVFSRPNPLYCHADGNDGGDSNTSQAFPQFDLSDLDSSILMDSKLGPVQVDLLLCPTLPNFPPRLDEVRKQDPVDALVVDVFTVPASLAGLPAISVPVPVKRPNSKPSEDPNSIQEEHVAGMQLIGQFWSDELVLMQASKLFQEVWVNRQ